MLTIFDGWRDFTLESIALRLLFATVCGGIIGLEREYKRRPAGFRTHIIICLGAALTTLTSQYVALVLGYGTDLTRMGAQVIAGIGFIGAGTIVVTRQKTVKGLTTAAGLWVTAIIGLAFGAGYFELGMAATILVELTEMVLSRLEFFLDSKSPDVELYVEYEANKTVDRIVKICQTKKIRVDNLEITRLEGKESPLQSVLFHLHLNRNLSEEELLRQVEALEGVHMTRIL
jgi:putative Mg2+ transporter-C (MgtC) family protein